MKTLVAAGGVWLAPLGYSRDVLGLGVSWVDPSSEDPDNDRQQWLVETWWRLQLTQRVELTPSLQLVINPSRGGSDFRTVGGLRLRVVL